MENISADEMRWPCDAKCSKARESDAGRLGPPVSDNLKLKRL